MKIIITSDNCIYLFALNETIKFVFTAALLVQTCLHFIQNSVHSGKSELNNLKPVRGWSDFQTISHFFTLIYYWLFLERVIRDNLHQKRQNTDSAFLLLSISPVEDTFCISWHWKSVSIVGKVAVSKKKNTQFYMWHFTCSI